ncbi:MAG: shikimate kinase [Ornithinimicrobium sp.]
MSAISPVLILIGPPGAGKSTIGAAMAQRLGVDFLDTDAAIEAAAGRSISDIFVDDGEGAFRQMELEAVLDALDHHPGVVSLGGGAVMTPGITQALERAQHTGTVTFLNVGIADAASRVGFDASRPMLVINPRASWNRLMNARRPTYERLAHLQIDTAGRDVPDICAEIQSAMSAQ